MMMPISNTAIDGSVHPAVAMARRFRLAVLGPGLLTVFSTTWAQPSPAMGTLLYSAGERSALVRSRDVATTAEQPKVTFVTVSGIVKRKGGLSTAWINRKPLPENQLTKVERRLVIADTHVLVGNKPVRIGESLDLTQGLKTDLVAPNAVSVRTLR